MLNLSAMFTDKKLKLFIFVFAFITYANTIGHDYIWDDSIVITGNKRVEKGILGIPDLFLKYNSNYQSDQYGYRPITLTTFAVDHSIFKNSPHAGHFMNIIYFAILCVILFRVLRRLLDGYTSLAPFLIALLFIVHPIHVEVVANIKSRDEILSLLFSLVFLDRLISYYDSGKVKYLIYSSLFFFLAFLSKENAIVFLAIAPLSLLYFRKWKLNLFLKSLSQVFLLSIISFVIIELYTTSTLGVSSSKGAGIYHESGIMGNSFFFNSYFFSSKIANAVTVLAHYLKNFVYPVHLVYYYGYNQIPVPNWTDPLTIISLFFHIGLLGYAVISFKTNKLISYSICFYFVSVSIYTHFVIVLADTMADRFLFAPSVGLIILVVFLLEKILRLDFKSLQLESVLKGKHENSIKHITVLKYGSIGLIIGLGWLTVTRNKVWKNSETLITNDMPYLQNCAKAHFYYADMLMGKLHKGFDANAEADMIAHFKKSISITSASYFSYIRLGSYLSNVKRFDESIAILNACLKYYNDQADPHYYIGQAYFSTGEFKKARNHLQRSLELAPEVSVTYYYLALALAKTNDFNAAFDILNIQRKKFGEKAEIYDALGSIYFDKGDLEQSTRSTMEMIKYGADPELVYGKIIGRYQTMRMDKEAAFYYNQAVKKGLFKRKVQ